MSAKPIDLVNELEQFIAENDTRPGTKCSACLLPEDYQQAVADAHAAGKKMTVVAKFLRTKGFNLTDWTLRRHANGHGK